MSLGIDGFIIIVKKKLPFKIRHYASISLDGENTSRLESIVICLMMVLFLGMFFLWAINNASFYMTVLFGLALLGVSYSLLHDLYFLIRSLLNREK